MQKPAVKTRFLGIDYGFARIGLAYSDETKMISSPWKTVTTDKKLEKTLETLQRECREFEAERQCKIEKVIIGMPYHMSGKIGIQADEVKIFSDQFHEKTGYEIVLWDERLTTVQADRSLREANLSRKKRTKHLDHVAASIILQSYLDQFLIA